MGGVLLWIALVDVLLEEMERRDAKEARLIAAALGFALSTALACAV